MTGVLWRRSARACVWVSRLGSGLWVGRESARDSGRVSQPRVQGPKEGPRMARPGRPRMARPGVTGAGSWSDGRVLGP